MRASLVAALAAGLVPARAGAVDLGLGVAGAAGAALQGEDGVDLFVEEAELESSLGGVKAGPLDVGAGLSVKWRPQDYDGGVLPLFEEALVTVGSGEAWTVTAGRFLAPMGTEEIDIGDVPFATHGRMFAWGSAASLMGAQVEAATPWDPLSATAFVANGMAGEVSPFRPAGGLRLDVEPGGGVALGAVAVLDGPGEDDATTWLSADLFAEAGPVVTALEATWGRVADPDAAAAPFHGLAMTTALMRGWVGGAVRLEWFRDPEGAWQGLLPEDGDAEKNAVSLSACVLAGLPDVPGTHAALEYRHDRSLVEDGARGHAVTLLLVATQQVLGGVEAAE